MASRPNHNRGTGILPVKNHGQDGHATVRMRQGSYLPHWTREGGVYSITFRLGDSLPQQVVKDWRRERGDLLRKSEDEKRELTELEQKRLQDLFSEKIEMYLDAGHGHCWMNRPEIARIVEEALKHFDGQRYRLLAWCIMPNHVHVVLKPDSGYELDKILHSWKSFTATRANKLLKRQGVFWQPESYDHLIRDDEDLVHAVEYTLNNPQVASLKNWQWVGSAPDILSTLEEA
jgi:REP element-mobilizing transposase RayT